MVNKAHVPPFVLRLEEVFNFSSGVTVLVGTLESGAPSVLAPCDVELVIGDQSRGKIRLEAERMLGPGSKERRAVETKAEVRADEVREQRCVLIHR